MNRPELHELAQRHYDLLIVGGGIQGCGIARDAALRGLKVMLVEQEDLASGTSSASSKLAHGGLRYLEQLRFGLVRESLKEREALLAIAPHLVRPLPFLLPTYRDRGRTRWKIGAGLMLYDLLAGRSSMDRHRMMTTAQVREAEPLLAAENLSGGAQFFDAQMNDARVVIENAIDAARHGAIVLTRAQCIDLIRGQHRIEGARIHDRIGGDEVTIRAQFVVNAAGPWYRRILEMQDLTRAQPIRLSRGSHIIVPPLTQGHALLLQARSDGRVFFVLPWKGKSLVGTTDVEFEGDPSGVRPTEAEIDYLLGELAGALQGRAVGRDDVIASFAGVRALAEGEAESVGELSREAEVREEAPGLICVRGGKYTTYRAVAERTVDLVATLLERSHLERCTTALRPLPGGDVPDMNQYFKVAEGVLIEETGLPVEVLRYLLGTYGARHGEILEIIQADPDSAELLEEGLPFLRAEVFHAVTHEYALDLTDLIWRRTYRGHLGPLDEAARRRWEETLESARRSETLRT